MATLSNIIKSIYGYILTDTQETILVGQNQDQELIYEELTGLTNIAKN